MSTILRANYSVRQFSCKVREFSSPGAIVYAGDGQVFLLSEMMSSREASRVFLVFRDLSVAEIPKRIPYPRPSAVSYHQSNPKSLFVFSPFRAFGAPSKACLTHWSESGQTVDCSFGS